MPTTINETEYPYERYVDGVLQISIDGHNWTDYLGRPLYSGPVQINETTTTTYTVPRHGIYQVASQITAPHFDAWTQSVLNQIYELTGVAVKELNKQKESNLSPFQQWEKSISG